MEKLSMKEFAIISVIGSKEEGLSFKEISNKFSDSPSAVRAGLKLLISKNIVESINIGKNNYIYKSVNVDFDLGLLISINSKINKIVDFLNSFAEPEKHDNSVEEYAEKKREEIDKLTEELTESPEEESKKDELIDSAEDYKPESFSINEMTELFGEGNPPKELVEKSDVIEDEIVEENTKLIDIEQTFMVDNVTLAKEVVKFFSLKTGRGIKNENSFESVLPYLEIANYSVDNIKDAISNYIEAFKKSKKSWSEISTFDNFFENILLGII